MMTKNQKIALGCGGGGCLGLIVLVVIGVVLYLNYGPSILGNYNRNSNINISVDRNSNSNSNANDNLNSNSDSSSSSSMSDDHKHRLLLAASLANDSEMMQNVIRKLGFVTDKGVSADYPQFVRDHALWAIRNREFINSVNTQESARAYVNAHIND
jgi:hypothetical protein